METNKEENEITADIDAKLQTALAGVTAPTTTKSQAADTKTKKAPAASGGGNTKTVTTKKGTLTF